MPTPWGTDNADEDYAPHMYIQHRFVGGSPASIYVGQTEYRVGVSESSGKPQVICEVVSSRTHRTTAMAIKDFPPKAKAALLTYLASEASVDLDPEDQEHIRRAFKLPQKTLAQSLRKKQKSREALNAFIQTASDGHEDVDTVKQRRRAKGKLLQ